MQLSSSQDSGHVTICTNHVTHCAYLIKTLYLFHICTKTPVSEVIRALSMKAFITVTIVSAGG